MKNFMGLMVVSLVLGSQAFAEEDFVPAELGLSPACSSKVFHAAAALCNKESKSDPAREHGCLQSQSQVNADSSNGAELELSFTVADADAFWYKIDLTDKGNCKFTIKSEQ